MAAEENSGSGFSAPLVLTRSVGSLTRKTKRWQGPAVAGGITHHRGRGCSQLGDRGSEGLTRSWGRLSGLLHTAPGSPEGSVREADMESGPQCGGDGAYVDVGRGSGGWTWVEGEAHPAHCEWNSAG